MSEKMRSTEDSSKYIKLFSSRDKAILVHIIATKPINPSTLNIISIFLSVFIFFFKIIPNGIKMQAQIIK